MEDDDVDLYESIKDEERKERDRESRDGEKEAWIRDNLSELRLNFVEEHEDAFHMHCDIAYSEWLYDQRR